MRLNNFDHLIKYLCNGFISLCSVFVMHAQEPPQQTLVDYMASLETQFDVKFSYRTKDVLNKNIAAPKGLNTLDHHLTYLRQKSHLSALRVDDRYISLVLMAPKKNAYCGQLVDAQTGEPLVGASVQIVGSIYGTTTNIYGQFSIDALKGHQIMMTYLGHEPILVNSESLTPGSCPVFLAKENPTNLEAVTIGRFFATGMRQRGQGNFSIDTESFGLLPGQTQNDALWFAQALPGVESINETVSTINIRGGANDENYISWEGIRMYQYGHFFGMISAFNPFLSTELDLYRSGSPGQYHNYISGAINIHSSDVLPQKTRYSYNANLLDTHLAVDMRASDKLGIKIAGRTSINRWLTTPIYDSYFERMFQDTEINNNQNNSDYDQVDFDEQFSFFDFGGKLIYQPKETTQVKFVFMVIANNFEFTESLPQVAKTNQLEQKSNLAGVSLFHRWNKWHKTSAKASINHYGIVATNQDLFSSQILGQDNEVLDLDTHITHDFWASDHNRFSTTYNFSELGVSNRQEVNSPLFFSRKKDVLRIHRLHQQWDYRSQNQLLKIKLSARVSHYSKLKKTLLEPSGKIEYTLNRRHTLSTSFEHRHQVLGQRVDLQSDFLGVEKRRWTLTAAGQEPIRQGSQMSIGWHYQKSGMVLSLDAFSKNITELSAQSQLFQNQYQFSKAIGAYSVKGVECALQKNWHPFTAWMGYTWSKNNYNFDRFVPAVFPSNLDIRHQLKWALNAEFENLKLSLGGHWHAGLPYTAATGTVDGNSAEGYTVVYATPNQERLSAYVRLDCSAAYSWWSKQNTKYTFNVGLINFMGQENVLSQRYFAAPNQDQTLAINRVQTKGLSLTPNASVTINW